MPQKEIARADAAKLHNNSLQYHGGNDVILSLGSKSKSIEGV